MRASGVIGMYGGWYGGWSLHNADSSLYTINNTMASANTTMQVQSFTDEYFGGALRRMVLETVTRIELMKRLPGCRKGNWMWFESLSPNDMRLLTRLAYRVDQGRRPTRVVSRQQPPAPPAASCRSWMTGRPRRC